eukprot:3191367-Pyramimonas_sp.AAC.1
MTTTTTNDTAPHTRRQGRRICTFTALCRVCCNPGGVACRAAARFASPPGWLAWQPHSSSRRPG